MAQSNPVSQTFQWHRPASGTKQVCHLALHLHAHLPVLDKLVMLKEPQGGPLHAAWLLPVPCCSLHPFLGRETNSRLFLSQFTGEAAGEPTQVPQVQSKNLHWYTSSRGGGGAEGTAVPVPTT